MSPVGGVGINLAVQDAVAAARLLAPALASGGIVPRSVLRRVQRRRWWPTALVQSFQRLAHRVVLGRALRNAPAREAATARPPSAPPPPPPANPPPPTTGRTIGPTAADARAAAGVGPARQARARYGRGRPRPKARLPWSVALLTRFPVLQRIPARLIAIGPLPEHAPAWARRPPRARTPRAPTPDRASKPPGRTALARRRTRSFRASELAVWLRSAGLGGVGAGGVVRGWLSGRVRLRRAAKARASTRATQEASTTLAWTPTVVHSPTAPVGPVARLDQHPRHRVGAGRGEDAHLVVRQLDVVQPRAGWRERRPQRRVQRVDRAVALLAVDQPPLSVDDHLHGGLGDHLRRRPGAR